MSESYNAAIVKCLRLAYRRGLAVIEAERRERETADTVQPGSVSVSAAGARSTKDTNIDSLQRIEASANGGAVEYANAT